MELSELTRVAKNEWNDLLKGDKPVILVGNATCGRSAGAGVVLNVFRDRIRESGLACKLHEVGCIGMCYNEPIVAISKPGKPLLFFSEVSPDDASDLFDSYIVRDEKTGVRVIGSLGEEDSDAYDNLWDRSDMKPQVRLVLNNCGLIDPGNLNHYLANKGYQGLKKCLGLKPQEIIDNIRESGLRGRGGAGFPTWRKWQFARDTESDVKYLICNADEGDPGAFMNRSLIEGDPHSLLEGMIIAGYAIGASLAYIYCRAEYPLALERLRHAIKQAGEQGFLGTNILDSDFNFNIKVKEGAGAFVCGEETALIASIEGDRGMPVPRPPFPAISGLWGKPTIINNVETLASVSRIMQNSPDWFA
ncbi:MAG: NADH-quinone oxidoreductase subunit F, partial [Bacteroidota bacterium]